jgi:vancomycin resistance protein YoaR
VRGWIRPLPFLAATLIVLLAAPVATVVGHHYAYANRAFPGVHLNGADISGQTPEQIFSLALTQSTYYVTPNLKLKAGDQVVDYRPSDFGAGFEPAATVRAALDVGRRGDWQAQLIERAQVWWRGTDVSPIVRMDIGSAARVVARIAEQVDQAAVNASLEIDPNAGTVRETPSQIGLQLDQTASVALIQAAIRSRANTEIQLPIRTLSPNIASTANAAAEASRLLSGELIVLAPRWDKSGVEQSPVEVFRITRAEIANQIKLETSATDGTVRLGFNTDAFRPRVQALAPTISQTSQNARFVFDDVARTLSVIGPSRDSKSLDVDATMRAVDAAIRGDNNRAVVMSVQTQPAPVPANASPQSLGITELITQATTFFKGSSAARIANIKLAASRFHGVVVPPGETFSFNYFLGDVSKDEGFEEGLVIVGDRTVKGVGGGVCQVSTTVFQAALRAGFPILERYPHGYRVSYYERGMGAGFDAAVFTPWADFKFRNDTAAHLLIETYYDPAKVTLTFKFYGTRDGRDVRISSSRISNVVPRGIDVYEPDPEGLLTDGQVKQVEFAVDGATIAFDRTVTRSGQTLIDETVLSRYVPWRAVYRFGPNVTPPAGVEVRAQP